MDVVSEHIKNIRFKIARLQAKRRLIESRNRGRRDLLVNVKIVRMQKEARALRMNILRSKRTQYGQLRQTFNSSYADIENDPTVDATPATVFPTILDDHQHNDVAFTMRSTRRNISERWGFGNRMTTCPDCKAIMWLEEKTQSSTLSQPKFSICCGSGQISLPLLPPSPAFLEVQLGNMQFKDHIRMYNSMLSFTSMGGKIDRTVLDGRGPYAFRIGGEVYHKIGSLLPEPEKKPKFAQLYIYDTEHEVQNRLHNFGRHGDASVVNESILEGLQHMLNDVNPYVKVFRNARDMMQGNDVQNLQVHILQSRVGRQYVRPTANEVAALIVGDGTENVGNRDIVVSNLDGTLRRIDETHPSYMPLQYPLLFPYGTDGWRRGINFNSGSSNSREGVSMRQFYAFRMQFREEEGKTLYQSGRLFQQFVVDCYAAIEQHRLQYVRLNQSKLRADLYRGLEDAITAGDVNAADVGKRYVLPSSFTGGPRNMIQHYQDAIAICRVMGPPDYFITFTCNPNWVEIRNELARIIGLRIEDIPDIVARVFRLKLKQLLKDFKKNNFLGKVIADIHVIEFQKRGLPHSHLLFTMAVSDKPTTIEEIDHAICAELPDKNVDPLAYESVVKFMIHGPCGAANPNAPCMVNGKCSKNYPKQFCNETTIDDNGYVRYRRRNYGITVNINGFEVDNRWVVPYNRDLIVHFDAHINIERCAQTKLIKYLYKYLNKGGDRATAMIQYNNNSDSTNCGQRYRSIDEVKQYLDCRYVSAIESCWRIFEFDLQQQYPSVERLQFHLAGEQFVLFSDADDIHSVVEHHRIEETMFTKWFDANKRFPSARSLTYSEFPTSFVWNRQRKEWTIRKARISIGRLTYAHPNSGERYYMRMLLNKVRGAMCYEDIRTVNGIVYPTYKAACSALGLLDDDNEWHEALTEASTWASSAQLRNMFCSMLMFSEVTNPAELWEAHWKDFTDDLQLRLRRETGNNDMHLEPDELRNLGLLEVEQTLNQNGRSLKDYPPMPLPSYEHANLCTNRLLREELDYDSTVEMQRFETLHAGMNTDQLRVFNAIMEAHTSQNGGLFFVYGCGGTGKTYLWNTLAARFRADKKIVLSIASSGIASLLLPGGRTAHSRFKIPLNPNETSCCSINQQTDLARLIQAASLVIWDEAPMVHRYAFEAVDRTFQDLLKGSNGNLANKVFGGKLFVLGGDFRQILPVVPKGGRESIVSASLLRSRIWDYCQVMHLQINMRVIAQGISEQTYVQLHEFVDWIMSVGDGKSHGVSFHQGSEPNWIQIPSQFLIRNDETGLKQLIEAIYPNLRTRFNDWSYLKERGILAPKNTDVDELNSIMLSMLPGDSRTYLSADTFSAVDNCDTEHDFHPPELLNSLNFPGVPNHVLDVKVGAPIMLLRNLNQSLGLCNGTRLVVQRLGDRVIEAKVITGSNAGEGVFIPRINLSPSAIDLPFALKRRQFPIKLAFAMTINKSQGQTLKSVGLYLPNLVFSHGQLYVAISRVTSPSGLKILIINKEGVPDDLTKNVVYREVLDDIPS